MAYCTAAQVRLRVITGLEDSDINLLIADAQSDLDDMLGGTSFDAAQKKNACVLLTKAFILERGQDSYSETESRRQLQEAADKDRAKAGRMISKQLTRWRVKDDVNNP